MTAIAAGLRRLVGQRASDRCEYCCLFVEHDAAPACVDHIIALKHGGATQIENLALSCYHYNSFKGDNIAGLDPETSQLTPLFNPRQDKWEDHFAWNGSRILGTSPIGRTTVVVMNLNDLDRVLLRELLLAAGIPLRSSKS